MPQQIQALTLPALVEHSAREQRDRIAVTDGEVRISYTDLNARRREAAKAFIASGLQHGDNVAIWAPNIHEWIIAAMGAQSVGGVVVPLNTRMKGSEAGYILSRSRARLLFTVTDFLGIHYPQLLKDEALPELKEQIVLRGEAEGTTGWQAFLARATQVDDATLAAREAAVQPEDTMDLLFTSGTTGRPKGVMSSHRQNIQAFATWANTVELTSDDVYLIINPFFHSFGYKAGWLAAVIQGCRIVPVLTFDLDQTLATIARERVTMLPGPPTIYQSLLSHPRRGDYDLSSLRLAVTGAAAVPVELVRQIKSELGFKSVVTAYGLTEASGVVTICRPDDDPEIIATTAGRAMPGVEVICASEQGEEVPRGEPGEVWIRGFNVMKGYFDDPEETARAITPDGWLKTGDVGVMDAAGNLRITDRMKDMFITGGFNVYPAEIENSLASLPGVAQSAVIGVPCERLGEVAKAYIVKTAGSPLTEQQVIDWCRERMANYKVPRYVEFLDAMPLNASGKILKPALREMAAKAG